MVVERIDCSGGVWLALHQSDRFAEISVRFSRIEDLDDALGPADFRRAHLPWTAALLAGRTFLAYRRNRGTASAPLPDFFIGAHAAVEGFELLTRDPVRCRTYFPKVHRVRRPDDMAMSTLSGAAP